MSALETSQPPRDIDDVDSSVHPTVSEPSITAQPASASGPRPVPAARRIALPTIPDDILSNAALNEAIRRLPTNYSFEVHKTLWRIRVCKASKVALQLPEGLLVYALALSDILERFGGVETVIMGDVTYGACCIDDFTARALGCDFMVHYGHSCLVPVDVSQMNTLYVFVDIGFSVGHLIDCMRANLAPDTSIVIAGTIQFTAAIHAARGALASHFPRIVVPQARPLSQGEVLGCTSPHLPTVYAAGAAAAKKQAAAGAATASAAGGCCKGSGSQCSSAAVGAADESKQGGCCSSTSADADAAEPPVDLTKLEPAVSSTAGAAAAGETELPWQASPDVCIFVADGRFHLESLMIHNPHIPRYLRYDPYTKILSEEGFDYATLHAARGGAIAAARGAKRWGVILGTLGRQGSAALLKRIEGILSERNTPFVTVLLSEVFPVKLAAMRDVDAWVQIACPRLSIDWGEAFPRPLLSTYEFDVVMDLAPWLPNGVYPMDFYSNAGGAWSNYHEREQVARARAAERVAAGGKGVKGAMAIIKAKRAAARAAAAEKLAAAEAASAAAAAVPEAEEDSSVEPMAESGGAVPGTTEFEAAVDAAGPHGSVVKLGDGISEETLEGGYVAPV